MRTFLLLILAVFSIKYSSAQLTKKNWLVGGTGLFNSTTSNSNVGLPFKSTNIRLSPNVGYFLLDKFAAGLKISYENYRSTLLDGSDSRSKSTTYSFGPFLRYYFLPAKKQFNLLIEGSYQHGIERLGGVPGYPLEEYTKNTLSIAGGPVLYFNSTVGLEFLVGFANSGYNKYYGDINTVQMGLGLQVHL